MHDAGKVIPGLLIFVLLATSPVWYNAATGQGAAKPELEKPTEATQCIESTQYMRSSHMELLNTWRNQYVRERVITYEASDGKTYDNSLTGECLRCHTDTTQFCDRCHNYADVTLYCWDCHLTSKEQR